MADENKRGIGARSAVARIAVAQTAERVGKRKIIQNHFENGVTVIFFSPQRENVSSDWTRSCSVFLLHTGQIGTQLSFFDLSKKIPLFLGHLTLIVWTEVSQTLVLF